MVFQNYALYPHKTVAQNMGFSLAMRGVPKAEIERAVAEAAEILGLTELLDRKPSALSGGQRQRVAMGRAIVRHPVAFLFDEPLSNLDAQLRTQMRGEIRALHQRLGATSIYVTHDQVEAMTMADQIVVMKSGHVEQVGAPLELYDRPRNSFVARFIGNPGMNLIKGRLGENRQVIVLNGGQSLEFASQLAAQPGMDIIVGIRAEHLNPQIEDNAGNVLEVVVETTEFTGAEQSVAGWIGGEPVSVLLRDRRKLGQNDKLRVSVPLDAIHLFDAKGTNRINQF
jgi:multiple sugar transport system ATP-binding protein